MVDKQHKNLLRDIGGYIAEIKKSNELKIEPVDFFIQSTYSDGKGEVRPCYLITKKGCEFVANKLTGAKGTQFTAQYVTRFNTMEERQRAQLPCTYLDALKALVVSEEAKAQLEAEKKSLAIELDRNKEWYSIKRVAALNHVSYKTFEWRKLKRACAARGYDVRKIFDANYGEVNTYHQSAWEAVYPWCEL